MWSACVIQCTTIIANFHLFLSLSFRMIQEMTKRTPCFLPAASFPPKKSPRTMWSITRTSGRSRNPKWGGRNESGATRTNRLKFCHSGWCVQQFSQWFPTQRGAARCWSPQCGRLSSTLGPVLLLALCILTDFYWRYLFFVVWTVLFSASAHSVSNLSRQFVSKPLCNIQTIPYHSFCE